MLFILVEMLSETGSGSVLEPVSEPVCEKLG